MKSDFEVLTYKFSREQDIKIIPLSDIHIGSKEFRQKDFESFIQRVIAEENTYVILNGDLLDTALKTSKTNCLLESTPLYEAKDYIAKQLKPLAEAGKILAVTEGNHERRLVNDAADYLGYDIACRLNIEDVYRPTACFIIIRFDDLESKSRIAGKNRPTYTICNTHGAGTTIRRFEDFGNIDNLDILIVGHTHKPIISAPSKLCIDTHNNQILEKQYKVCVAGSWLNYGGYALEKMYKPGGKALEVINLCGDHKQISITMY